MFNETTPYTGPTYPPNSPYGFGVGAPGGNMSAGCAPGSTQVKVNGVPQCWSAADFEFYDVPIGPSESMNVTPKKADAWTNWVIYGGVALVLLALLKR